MARPRAILQSDFPYHISARCINKEWFNLPLERVWAIFSEELTRTVLEKNLLVHNFVLMANHFHLIVSTPDANVSQCMLQFMTKSSRRLTREGNRINETFAGRHYKCVLDNHFYFLNAYKYVYRNPVKAGLCENVEDYEFSTLHGLINPQDSKIPLCEDTLFNEGSVEHLKWLNTAPDPVKLEAFRKGLGHQIFRSPKNRLDGTPIISKNVLL